MFLVYLRAGKKLPASDNVAGDFLYDILYIMWWHSSNAGNSFAGSAALSSLPEL